MTLQISRILHAGYLLQSQQASIAFDPLFENPFSRNCYAYPSVEFDYPSIRSLKLDAVFISHYHDDHCSLESLQYLDKQIPIYLYCIFPEIHQWIREIGFANVHNLEINSSINIGDFEITPRRALDANVDCLFHIKVQNLNILNVVDSWIDDLTLERLKQTSWDLIMWPFQTMQEIEVLSPHRFPPSFRLLPEEWLTQIKFLKPKALIPSSCQFIHESWSWYRFAYFPISYEIFAKQIQKISPEIFLCRLNPSRSIYLSTQGLSPAPSIEWITIKENEDVDYEYQPNQKVPGTHLISQHMEELNVQQLEYIFVFCKKDILKRYSNLTIKEEGYFSKERLWQLSVFDCNGIPKVFYYQLKKGQMEIINTPVNLNQLAWTTEIPMARLYGALKNGESLSSLYIRINDCFFSQEVEKDLLEADLLEDPLLRCLYEGQFGTYQQAQLERLKTTKSPEIEVL